MEQAIDLIVSAHNFTPWAIVDAPTDDDNLRQAESARNGRI
jgi:hypothetical protein